MGLVAQSEHVWGPLPGLLLKCNPSRQESKPPWRGKTGRAWRYGSPDDFLITTSQRSPRLLAPIAAFWLAFKMLKRKWGQPKQANPS